MRTPRSISLIAAGQLGAGLLLTLATYAVEGTSSTPAVLTVTQDGHETSPPGKATQLRTLPTHVQPSDDEALPANPRSVAI